jgi:hypothetical protein
MIATGLIFSIIAILLLSLAAIEFRRGQARFLLMSVSRQAKAKLFWVILLLRLVLGGLSLVLAFTSFTIARRCDDQGRCTVTLPVSSR